MNTTTINGITYTVSRPRNSWDMNYHFIDADGADHLVDLQDVIDWKYRYDDDEDLSHIGASIEDAIEYANSYSDLIDGFWWKIA
jgi:hypothetical protein